MSQQPFRGAPVSPSEPAAPGGRVAVVGSGAAGLAAALCLSRRHEVHLFEAAPRLGGHCNTVTLDDERGPVAVDTGFIVFNPVNYPVLCRAFAHLGIASQPSEMSFSVSTGRGAFEYSGRFPGGLLAQRANLLRPRMWSMLAGIRRFYAAAAADLPALEASGETLGDYLARRRLPEAFRDDHLAPMAAAIWSQPQGAIADMPAASLIRFFAAHGLLRFKDRPQWRTVTGGSRVYVARIESALARAGAAIHAATPIAAVRRGAGGVALRGAAGSEFGADHVVLAVHADQARVLLTDRDEEEDRVLGAFGYRANRAVLHRDPGLMPRRRAAWASWNYIVPDGPGGPQGVTYWMNRLQNLDTESPVFVTLNPPFATDPSLTVAAFDYAHPVFDRGAVAAQPRLAALQGRRRTWLCGSYFGYGFHEDAFASGVAAARAMGATAPWQRAVFTHAAAAAE